MLVAVFGLAFVANAQSDQCKTDGGGYVSATVSDYRTGDHKSCGRKYDNGIRYIKITTTPNADAKYGGKVLCRITYIDSRNGEKQTQVAELDFNASKSTPNDVTLEVDAKEIKDIELWGATCTSTRPRTW
ncbi:MAG: hypothetical protein KBT45_07285 [Bacteroidales bacterium]|nr:hypothetical protein [Candidatus Colimorpha pelethequi]